ncbi:MAG: hypothetical protein WBB67_12975 [bacterium]
MKKQLYGSLTRSKKDTIFLIFTFITAYFCFQPIVQFIGLLEKQGHEIGSHPLWQIFGLFMFVATMLIPFLCLAIIVLAASSFREHLRHKKIENRRISRKITAVLVGVSILIGLTIVLPGVVGMRSVIAQLVRWCLPPLVGGLAAGYIARRKGWLFGLLIIAIPGIYSIPFVLLSYYWEVPGAATIQPSTIWWLLLLALVAGSGGGYLGELLFKIRHKCLKNSK